MVLELDFFGFIYCGKIVVGTVPVTQSRVVISAI
jgi:hypothetical protein